MEDNVDEAAERTIDRAEKQLAESKNQVLETGGHVRVSTSAHKKGGQSWLGGKLVVIRLGTQVYAMINRQQRKKEFQKSKYILKTKGGESWGNSRIRSIPKRD